MMSGANTLAVPQPELEPDVTAKIKRMTATANHFQLKALVFLVARITCQCRYADEIQTLPLCSPQCVCFFDSHLIRDKEDTDYRYWDGDNGDKPEDPRPTGELNEYRADDEPKHCAGTKGQPGVHT